MLSLVLYVFDVYEMFIRKFIRTYIGKFFGENARDYYSKSVLLVDRGGGLSLKDNVVRQSVWKRWFQPLSGWAEIVSEPSSV